LSDCKIPEGVRHIFAQMLAAAKKVTDNRVERGVNSPEPWFGLRHSTIFAGVFGGRIRAVVLRFGIGVLAIAATLGAQTHVYTSSAGTVPHVVVPTIAGGPSIGSIPNGPHVIQPVGALGGAYLGNSYSKPLGGGIVVNGAGSSIPPYLHGNMMHGRGSKGSTRGVGFATYVPNYYAPYGYGPYWDAPAETPTDAPPQPVIVNQYYTMPPPPPGDIAGSPSRAAGVSPAGSGDLLAPAEDYYLIAYRNRSIYAALTWWLEGNTLHYVTTQNTHNQAALDLIDLDKTIRLNQDRDIPFSIPGR
jgi:hypothetical protein